VTMSEPRLYVDPPKPDRLAVAVRAVCGALLGAVVALSIWLRSGGLNTGGTVLLFGVAVVVCTAGAIRYGDSFWESILPRR
jgi:hypothetical protein